MTNGAVKPSYLRTIVYLENMYVMNCICMAIQGNGHSFLSLQSLGGLLEMSITFSLTAYSIIKELSLSPPSWRGSLGWEKILFFIIFPQHYMV